MAIGGTLKRVLNFIEVWKFSEVTNDKQLVEYQNSKIIYCKKIIFWNLPQCQDFEFKMSILIFI